MYDFARITPIEKSTNGFWYLNPNSVEQVVGHFNKIFGKEEAEEAARWFCQELNRKRNLNIDIMAKKFSELNAGDSVWIWWCTKLYEFEVQELNPLKYFMIDDEGGAEIESDGVVTLCLKGGAEFVINADCINAEAFIYGSDGWHEYKIIGTNKDAVKKCLKTTLENDKETLEVNTRAWLAAFGEGE